MSDGYFTDGQDEAKLKKNKSRCALPEILDSWGIWEIGFWEIILEQAWFQILILLSINHLPLAKLCILSKS